MTQQPKTVAVRVLDAMVHEGKPYRVNQVVKISESDAKRLKKNGTVDDTQAAVDYCVNELEADVIEHVSAADEQAAIDAETGDEGKSSEETPPPAGA